MYDAKKDLLWVLGILIMIALVWYFTGGPSRPSATSGLFLNQPTEKSGAELQRQTEKVISEATQTASPSISGPSPSATTTESFYKGKVRLRVGYEARESNPQREYVQITSSYRNDKPIRITGWILEGKRGLDISIGQGAYLVYSAQVNPQQDIFLSPGETAIIVSGASPIGTSFRLNKCTGYFAQFNDFYPYLPTDCPSLAGEDPASTLDDQCLDYLDRLPACTMQLSVPPNLSFTCQNYINNKVNYKTCVELHKNDSDFYKPEWRIYLNRREDLWKSERETIVLMDQDRKIIDWASY